MWSALRVTNSTASRRHSALHTKSDITNAIASSVQKICVDIGVSWKSGFHHNAFGANINYITAPYFVLSDHKSVSQWTPVGYLDVWRSDNWDQDGIV